MDKLKVIAHIRTDFPEKFGIPRQSGLVDSLYGRIVLEPEYRTKDALDGILEFSHLWLLWGFEGVESDHFVAKVRPPRLGGNETRGVFATRSPFRPNPIGLSSVKLVSLDYEAIDGPVIIVSGIDMKDNTPIYDIKPYLAYVDAHPDAKDGFAGLKKNDNLSVEISDELLRKVPENKRAALIEILSEDPRPHYHDDPERVYGMAYAGMNIKFTVNGPALTVLEITQK